MSYVKTEWQTGDIITAEKLNNIEDGIANAGGGGSIATVSITGNYQYDQINGMIWDSENNEVIPYVVWNSAGVKEINVVLYQGVGYLFTNGNFANATGDVEPLDADNWVLVVTGNGSATITGLS